MDCEHATNHLWARADGELAADDAAALDAHLAGCAACRTTADEAAVQDAALLRAFAPRRAVAAAIADRVAEAAMAEVTARAGRTWDGRACPPRWAGWAAALLTGVAAAAVAVLLFVDLGRASRPAAVDVPAVANGPSAEPIARLTLATGDVFVCPSEPAAETWTVMAAGDPVAPGARVRTAGAAKCELELSDGSRVRMNTSTEARFAGTGVLQVVGGQLWSAVPTGATPLHMTAGQARVTADPAATGTGTHLDVACAPGHATVTVVHGSADVTACGGAAATVRGGQVLTVPLPAPSPALNPAAFACVPVVDPVSTTAWQDDLLLRRAADDPESRTRAGHLMTRVAAERSTGGGPGAVEAGVRARGDAWGPVLAAYLRRTAAVVAPEPRQAAARLLADVAVPRMVPDLIDLLGDADVEVRGHAAAGLRRLTGHRAAAPTAQPAPTDADPAAAAAWRTWWEQNRGRYAH